MLNLLSIGGSQDCRKFKWIFTKQLTELMTDYRNSLEPEKRKIKEMINESERIIEESLCNGQIEEPLMKELREFILHRQQDQDNWAQLPSGFSDEEDTGAKMVRIDDDGYLEKELADLVSRWNEPVVLTTHQKRETPITKINACQATPQARKKIRLEPVQRTSERLKKT